MPVTNSYVPGSFTGNGASTVYAYGFKIAAQGDLLVKVAGITKTITTDYTVSGVGSETGGNVTFTSAPANGASITIERNVAYTRPTDYQRNGAFDEPTVDADFDRLAMQVQQLDDRTKRSPVLALPIPGITTPLILPQGAGKGFRWNVGGTALEVVTLDDLGDTFLQSGSGAVARSWAAKVAEIVSVKDFGAVGNGVTNDTAAIQAAIDYLHGLNKGRLLIPAGTYLVNSALTYYSNLVIEGDGMDSSVINIDGATSGITCPEQTAYVTLRDLTIHGPLRSGGSGSSSAAGIKVLNAQHIHIERVECMYFNKGVVFDPGTMAGGTSSFSNTISSCRITSNTVTDIELNANSNAISIYDTVFSGTGKGIHCVDSDSLVVLGGTCAGASSAAIDIDATATLSVGAFIAGVNFENCGSVNGVIRLGASNLIRGVEITACFFQGNGTDKTPIDAINVDGLRVGPCAMAPGGGQYATSADIIYGTVTNYSVDGNTLFAAKYSFDDYTAASAACTGAITTAAVWKLTKVGKIVTLTLPITTGTASATTNFAFGTAIPSQYRPVQNTTFPCCVRDNAARAATPGMIYVGSGGTIQVFRSLDAATNFTAAADAGLQEAQSVSWVL